MGLTFGVRLFDTFNSSTRSREEYFLGYAWPTAESAVAAAYRWVRHGIVSPTVYHPDSILIPSFRPGEKIWLRHHMNLVISLNERARQGREQER